MVRTAVVTGAGLVGTGIGAGAGLVGTGIGAGAGLVGIGIGAGASLVGSGIGAGVGFLLWKYYFVDTFVSSLMRPIMVRIGKDSNFFVLICCKNYIIHGLGIGQVLRGYCKLSV